MILCVQLPSFSIMFLRFTHFAAFIRTSFTFMVIHSSANVHLCCFCPLANINCYVSAAVNIPVFSSFRYIRKCGIFGSHCNSRFNYLRNYQTVFQSSSLIPHSYQQHTRAPISPHPRQHLFLSSDSFSNLTSRI